jgi:GTPase
MAQGNASKLIEIERPPIIETAVVVRHVDTSEAQHEIDESLAEIRRLAWTAGAEVVCTIMQRRARPCARTLIGKGKLAEVKAACEELEADMVIFDCDLTPAQGSNVQDAIGIKVVDRTQLILDIFGQRARTNEGKHQVELAQLNYLLPRLAGRGSVMRQQGGIGVRGPGEQKLEVDRRVIRERIGRLKGELKTIRKNRQAQRKRRATSGIPTVALVGYTNAGKSSLLNALTGADAFVEDKLFATLDPTTRRCTCPSGREVVFSDTVGFVRNLPHSLVAAFRATLEEVNEADLLLVVADASDPVVEEHIRAVFGVLDEIGVEERPMLKVFNKTDVTAPNRVGQLLRGAGDAVAISARKSEGLEALLQRIDAILGAQRTRLRLRIPHSEGRLVSRIRDVGAVYHQEYDGDVIVLDAEVPPALESAVRPFAADPGGGA